MMRADLKPYRKYKDSTAPWLGIIPDHWRLERTKYVLRQRVEKGFPNEPLLAATQTKGVVRKEHYENRTVLAMKDLHLLKLVRRGDFVISLRSFQGGIEYARDQGIISPAYTVLYPASPERHSYLARLFKSKPYVENLSLFVTGIRQGQNVDYEKLSRSTLPLPPPDEQRAIVRFLTVADRKIRKYIRAKQKLIKLLEEQKQAIIHQAVTRGVDPNVNLKPSGIEWLGDVPSHWEVLALKRVLRRLIDCEHKTAPKVDQSAFLVARTSSVRNGTFRREGAYATTAEAFAQWTRRGVPEVGDIIFTREAPAGEACMVPDDVQVCLGQRTVLLKVNRARCVPDWLLHMIYAGPPRLRIQLASQGSTVGHFNVDDIGWMQILLPPATEQSRICRYLDTATAPIRAEIGRLLDSIERLQELRTRLFADVVTGKLDVRAAAADLPDEPEEAFKDVEPQIENIDDADTDVTEAAEVAE